MAEPQDTMRKLAHSFDLKKGELSRYELAAARHVMVQAAEKAPASTIFPWWIDRIDARLHFIDTGEFVPDPPKREQTPEEKKAGTIAAAVLVGIGVLVVGGCALLVSGGDDDEEDASSADEIGASVICEQFVEDRLRSPGTADFASYPDQIVTGGPTQFTVRAWVDSENGFGALLRTNYSCTVSSTDGDSWTLVDLTTD